MTRTFDAGRLWALPRVGAPAVVGPGRLVVPVTTYDIGENQGSTRLWLVDGEAPAEPLTPEELNASKPIASPDMRKLAFVAGKRGESDRQLYIVDLLGGEPEAITDLPLGCLGGRWLPDGSGLIVLSYLLRDHLSTDATAAELERRKAGRFTVHATEFATYRYWDIWLTTGEVPHLFHLDLGDRQITDLTPNAVRWWDWPSTDDPWDNFDISPDGRYVAFSADASEPPHRQLRHSIFELDLATGEERELTPTAPSHATRPRYSPDGREILFGQQLEPGFYGDRVRLAISDRASGLHRILTEDFDRSADRWTFDGRGEIIFLAEDNARTALYRLPTAGGPPAELARGGTLASPVVDGEGTVFLLRHSFTEPPEVVRLDADGALVAMTHFTAIQLQDLAWAAIEDHTIAGANGEPVQFYLVNPGGERERMPLVHLIHGGPHACFGDAWQWRWHAQVFAGMGFRVAMVNFHGSTSFGQSFTTSIRGAWGDMPYRDIEAVTDHLVGQGLVDETAMAIAGGSYGGYLTAFLTSQTDRYAAAIVHAGVTNLGGTYASDFTAGRPQAFGAEIFEDRARVDRYSPSSHAAGYNTPTLVIHGEKDYRVPHTQGLELYGVLKAKGVPARLLFYPGENHWILSPQASLHWYGEVERWLKLYLTVKP
jgi:dipeptidyl aminopeptidase/acylaminoacyl peptidase